MGTISYSRIFQVISSNILSAFQRIDKTTMGNACNTKINKNECESKSSCYWHKGAGQCTNGRVDERQAGPLNGLPVGILNLVAAYDKLDIQQD